MEENVREAVSIYEIANESLSRQLDEYEQKKD
jgi:hypothetical protein